MRKVTPDRLLVMCQPARRTRGRPPTQPRQAVTAGPAARRPAAARPLSALATVLIAATLTLSACGSDATTSTSADRDSLGRPIGGQQPTARGAGGLQARAAARAFLTSYLAVSYGRAKPGELRNATRALRDRLRAQAARVPPGIRQRRPNVIALRVDPVADGQVRATATVEDGDVAPYPLFATLERQAGDRWIVTTVGG